MGLAQQLSLAEAVKPLTAYRYLSFDVVGTMTCFQKATDDELAVIGAEAGKFTNPDYDFRPRIGLPNAVDAAS